MLLTDEEKKMADGEYGLGVQRAMTLLTKYGDIFGADKMVKVDRAHILGDSTTEFIREMTEGVTKVRTLTTTHASFDPTQSRELGINVKEGDTIAGGVVSTSTEDWNSRVDLFKRIGILPTFTCTPYLIGFIPMKGEVLSMVGSLGQILVNSVFGASSNREGISVILASAITGRTPKLNLLVKGGRYATVLVQLNNNLDFNRFTSKEYGALGYYIGGLAGDRNVVINGLPNNHSFDLYRSLMSPMPISGAVVMCHIVGITPEAPTLEAALGGNKPNDTIIVGEREIKETMERLNSADSNEVDLVAIGCPHCTFQQIEEIASLLQRKRVNINTRLQIGVAQPMYTLAKMVGYADIIEKAGGFFTSSCVSALNPIVALDNSVKVAATTTVGPAHRLPELSKGRTKVFYGDTVSCINAAIKGKWRG